MTNRILRNGWVVAAALAGSLAVAACGLISSDVTDFDLTLPDKKFSVDTDSWQIDQDAANVALSQSCASDPNVCSVVKDVCTMGCSGVCNATKKTCDLSLDVNVAQSVDLISEKPELKSINDQSIIDVTIDTVTYEIPSNTLNVATPPLTVYIAPSSVVKVDTTNAQIKAIGTIDAVPAGQTSGPKDIKFTADGKKLLVDIMKQFKTPFNILVGASITVSSGQEVPTGKLEAVVHIRAHAGI